jgi:hypothetical protein
MNVDSIRRTRSVCVARVVITALALAIIGLYFLVRALDRQVIVRFRLPTGYRGYFAVISGPNLARKEPVTVAGSWRNRTYDIIIPRDGIASIETDECFTVWHRPAAVEAGHVSFDESQSTRRSDNGNLFFIEGESGWLDDGVSVHWMFYGDRDDYVRRRGLAGLSARIDEINSRLRRPR